MTFLTHQSVQNYHTANSMCSKELTLKKSAQIPINDKMGGIYSYPLVNLISYIVWNGQLHSAQRQEPLYA